VTPRRPPQTQPSPPKTAASRPAVRSEAPPPLARRQRIVETLHDERIADPYRWLEDAGSKESQAWVAAEDGYARRLLGRLPGRELIAARLKRLSYIDWNGAPVRRGTRYFFSRQHADREKIVHYWREGEHGKPRVLIDPNLLSSDGSVALRGVHVSHDGKWAAYKLSANAADMATLYVMEVATGEVSKIDTIEGARYAEPSWTPRSDGFYYTRIPVDPAIPAKELPGHAAVYFHRLGEDPIRDRLVHARTGDARTFIGADLSRDGKLLVLYIQHGWSRADLYYQQLPDARTPRSFRFKRLVVGVKALFSCFAWRGDLYVHTNDGAPRYRLYKVDPRRMARRHWREIVPERADAVLDGFAIVGDHLALHYLERSTTRLEIADLEGKLVRKVAFTGLGSASNLSGNPEDDTAYYSFSSYTTPSTVYRTSVKRGGRAVYFQVKVPIDPSPYAVEQVSYPSRDGTMVTMFIVRRKDAPSDGSSPLLLTGYGGFNISLTPAFSASRFVWLEQGGSLAIPNLRGGGEYGEEWHQAGMLLRKQTTFDDFIAAAEFLIRRGYTRPDRLAIAGGSNGGLLVGAAMTQRPDLFRVVSCHVPLLDMVRYHLFGAGTTWISEYGSADDAVQLKAIAAYSPYHQVRPKTPYPALLMMSADSDDRVDPMHARKFTAAIRHASTSKRLVLLRVETKAGHGGGDMIKKYVEATADEYAFLLHELGVKPRRR
jgi:prolyl oligopeptidase